MKNVTVSLDDASYRNARRRAAENDRSLSSVVREVLATYGAEDDGDDHHARLRTIWAELDARDEGIAAAERMTRAELYDAALAERSQAGA